MTQPLPPNLYAQGAPGNLAGAPGPPPGTPPGPPPGPPPGTPPGPITLPPQTMVGAGFPTYVAPQIWSTQQPGLRHIGPRAETSGTDGTQPGLVDRVLNAEADATYNRPEFKKAQVEESQRAEGHILADMEAAGLPGTRKLPPEGSAAARRQDLIFNAPVPGQNEVTDDAGVPVTTTIPAHTELLVDPSIPPEMEGAAQKSIGGVQKQQDAVEEAGQAAAEAERVKAKGAEDVGASLGKEAENRQTRADEEKKFTDEWREKVAQAHYGAYQAGISMDPNHYFKNLGTWDRVRLALSSFLGGFSQGLGKTSSNVGLDEIHRGIDEDLANQRAQVEAKKSFAGNLDSLYAQAYKATGNYGDATALAKSLTTRMVAQQALAAAIRSGAPLEIAKAKELAAKLEEHEGTLWRQRWQDQVSVQRRVPAQTVTTGGAGGGDEVDWKAQEQLSKDLREAKIPQAEQAIEQAQAGIANGNTAGISSFRQALPGGEGNAARSFGGPGVSSNLQNLDQLAYAVATTTGRGQVPDEKKVELIKSFIRGDGSPEAYVRGLDWAQHTVADEKANIKSGPHPTQVLIHDVLEAIQKKRAALANYQAVGSVPGAVIAGSPGAASPAAGAPPGLTPEETAFIFSLNPQTEGKKAGAGGGKPSKGDRPHFEKPVAPLRDERRR